MKEFTSKAQAAEQERTFQFKLDDESFTCVLRGDGDAVLEWSELAAGAVGEQDADLESAEGAAFLSRFFRLMMAPDQYARFRRHMKAHTTSTEVLVEIMQAVQEEMQQVVEDTAERPTGQPSPSSDGRAVMDERMLQLISMPDADVVISAPPPPEQPKARRARKAG